MSKEVDTSDLGSLSRDDLLYLRDRGRLTPAQEEEFLSEDKPTRQGGGRTRRPKPSGEAVGDTGATPDASGAEPEPGEANEGPDYDSWERSDLLAELGNRELSKKGAHDVLVARLLEDDARAEAEG